MRKGIYTVSVLNSTKGQVVQTEGDEDTQNRWGVLWLKGSAEELERWIMECLPWKHQDPSSDPQLPCKKAGVEMHICNPSPKEVERGRSP